MHFTMNTLQERPKDGSAMSLDEIKAIIPADDLSPVHLALLRAETLNQKSLKAFNSINGMLELQNSRL